MKRTPQGGSPHAILLGDSIFDNAAYVPGQDPVLEQLRMELPRSWRSTLLAVDGNVASDVKRQLQKMPADASHLVLSVGGNDALNAIELLRAPSTSVMHSLAILTEIRIAFEERYYECLASLLALDKPLLLCTIYDSVPNLTAALRTALCLFNDTIVRLAVEHQLPVLDLRAICRDQNDYSPLSPIEPSSKGGQKIARGIANVLMSHDFDSRSCRIFG